MVKGMILVSEAVQNKDRHFGAANNYIPAWVRTADGKWGRAFFTHHEVGDALTRGTQNPEDLEDAFRGSKPPEGV